MIYKDSSYSYMERAKDLLSHMTIEEKVGQLMQIPHNFNEDEYNMDEWITKKCVGSILSASGKDTNDFQKLAEGTRLGIPILFGIDCIHGHALHPGATIFPSQLALSSSWDSELVKDVGEISARETAADGVHWTFSPVLCIARDTRWGRCDETFGEDPFLIGELGASMIKGYQGDLTKEDQVLACAKHYIAYGESVGGRDSYDASITMRRIREIFLPPFAKAVEAGVETFMTGYLPIDGTPCTINKTLMKDVLRDELKYDGFVVTDWDNVNNLLYRQFITEDIKEASKSALEAGNDMIMTSAGYYDGLIEAVKEGKVKEADIDKSVMRILLIKFKLKLFDSRRYTDLEKKENVFTCKSHVDKALEAAQKTVVLLENKNNCLPLKNIKSIAVIGPGADDLTAQYGDWSYETHPQLKRGQEPKIKPYTILEGIKELSQKKNIKVSYAKGCDYEGDDVTGIKEAVSLAKDSDAIVVVIGDTVNQNGEYKDRADLSLWGMQNELVKALKETKKPLIAVLLSGKPLEVKEVSEVADAFICTFNSGMMGGLALAQAIFGEINPSGKLSISFPYHVGQLPVYYNQLPGWHGEKYIDMPNEALYSFGHGLSYTEYIYSDLKLSASKLKKDEALTVKVNVCNNGDFDGDEIVQLYICDDYSSVITPRKQLKGFKRIHIKAHETKEVSIDIPFDEFAIVNINEERVVEPGTFTIMVGRSSNDKEMLKDTVTM